MANEDIIENIENIRNKLESEEEVETFEKLLEKAKAAEVHRFWINRFLFGVGLAKAVENWLEDTTIDLRQPLTSQVPKERTREVVAAWMRFNFIRNLFVFGLSSILTIFTAVFLYKQLEHQRDEFSSSKRVEYTQFLYNEKCDSNGCEPEFNSRLRAEAALAYIGVSHDMSNALLQSISLSSDVSHMDFSRANFFGADLSHLNCYRCSFSKANFQDASLFMATFEEAIFEGAVFHDIEYYKPLMSDSLKHSELLALNSFSNTKFHRTKFNGTSFSTVVFNEFEC